MNTTEFKGNWQDQMRKLKQRFPMLSDKDFLFEDGKQSEMLNKLQIKLGKTKEEFQKIFESL